MQDQFILPEADVSELGATTFASETDFVKGATAMFHATLSSDNRLTEKSMDGKIFFFRIAFTV